MGKSMSIKFKEFSQELAIISGMKQEAVDSVLSAYSAAVQRALREGFIVEVVSGVLLKKEEYFDPRNNRTSIRMAVHTDRHRSRRRGEEATSEESPVNECAD